MASLPVFLTYFVAAIRTLFPTACANTLALLEAAVLPPLTSLVTAIVNDLDSLADDAGPGARRCLLAAGSSWCLTTIT